MIEVLWEAYQQTQIHGLNESSSANKLDTKHTGDLLHIEVQRLEAKIDGLALICQALWEIVQTKTDATTLEIEQKIKEIDLRDGREDGKITGKTSPCPKCKRPAHSRQRTCMYCGTSITTGNAVEKPLVGKPKLHIR